MTKPVYSLCGERVSLRGLEPDDVDSLYMWENDTSVWPCGSTRAPLTRHQLWNYINEYDGDIFSAKQLRLMIVEKESGRRVGTIDIYDFDAANGHAKIGIFIAENDRQKNYATEALNLAVGLCRDAIGMHQLAALVSVDNKASNALFVKSGFKVSGKLRSWIKRGRTYDDVLMYQLLFE